MGLPANISISPLPILKDNYVWVICNHTTHHALIVDPGAAEPVSHYLSTQGLTLVGIVITHHHGDHTQGILPLLKQYRVPVYGPKDETIPGITHPLTDNDWVEIPHFPLPLQVIAVPGHTLGHIAYYHPGVLFSGDTLFGAGCGRLFEGSASQLFHSLEQLAQLPLDTHIYCAHEYTLTNLRFARMVEPNNPAIAMRLQKVIALGAQGLPSLPTTLAEEKLTNPFLRCKEMTLASSVAMRAHILSYQPLDIFTYLRKWKDQFV